MVKRTNKVPFRLRLWKILLLTWPFIVLAIFISAALIHLASTGWRELYLYNGDSITLGLVAESITRGEAFNWTFSSQLFLFPEGVIYGICYVITQSPQLSFIFNSVLNITILYILLYLIGIRVLGRRLSSQVFALTGTGITILYMLLENIPSINGITFTTLYLFNTYYYGVILSSFAVMLLSICTLRFFTSTHYNKKGLLWTIFGLVILTALTQLSNSLFLLQFSAPFLIVITLLLLINKMRIRTYFTLSIAHISGLIIGYGLKDLFKDLIPASVNRYINIDNIPSSIYALKDTIHQATLNRSTTLEYIALGAMILFAILSSLYVIYRSSRLDLRDKSLESSILLVTLFAAVSPVVIIGGIILTGNSYTRYLIPIAFFPTLALLPVGLIRNKLIVWSHRIVLLFMIIIALIYILAKVPESKSLTTVEPKDSVSCFIEYGKNRSINAVGGFWSSRPLDLYADKNDRVLQVNEDFTIYKWMNNTSSYKATTFDSVIVDKVDAANYLDEKETDILGSATTTYNCETYSIKYYDKNTPGYTKLNNIIHK